MCGIIGHVSRAAPPDPERVAAARDRMAHRGPDDAGLWAHDAVCLGFRRLSVLDLTAAGHQPMASPCGSVVLVFNGEVYNWRELRRELAGRVAFQSGTDTEVLLHAIVAWGFEAAVRRADGMFACAAWDARTQTLHAARDRVGQKPFFYAESPRGLAFASTLDALRALVPTGGVDPEALDAYLTYQAVPAPYTMVTGARQLPPAHTLTYDLATGRLRTGRYWDLPFVPKRRASDAEVLDDVEGLVRAAVRRRLASDRPLGAFLSGGVDSSLVVALMAQESSAPVEAVVMGFDDPDVDERPFARAVAERWGVRLHEHVMRPDAVGRLPGIVWHYGQPVADVSIVPTFAVAQAARQHVTVVLNGDGGDEAFGGYARPAVARAAQAYRQWVPSGLRRGAHRALGPVNGHAGLARWARMLTTAGAVEAGEAFVYDRAFREHRAQAYAPALAALAHPDRLYRQAWDRARAADDADRALYGDLVTYLPDQLLAKMDVSTMAHGVEARAPLLDTALLEYAARLPTAQRLRGMQTKGLLKRLAARHVPSQVVYRRKRGFVMPADRWLRGPLAAHVEAALDSPAFRDRDWIRPAFVRRMLDEHRAGASHWSELVWTLFVLELWARIAVDGTLGPDDSLEALR